MKTLTKKAIVLASAIAVAGTFAVCAASYDGDAVTATNPTTDNRSVTVSFSTDVAATDQITILAYYAPTGAETPDAKNIVYIDQVQKDALSSLTFSLRDDDATGAYKVLMGGTGVAKAGAGSFTLSAPAPTGSTISGTVGPVVYFGDEPEMADYNAIWKTNISLQSEAYEEISSMDVNSGGTTPGYFEITGIADGTYILAISRVGMCTKYVSATVAGGNLAIGDIALLGADTNADLAIDGADVSDMVNAAADAFANGTYAEINDPNADYAVDGADISDTLNALSNFSGYQAWDQ